MQIVFATNTQDANRDLLKRVGADHQLLSYWYLKSLPPTFLRDYVNATNGVPTHDTPTTESRTNRLPLKG